MNVYSAASGRGRPAAPARRALLAAAAVGGGAPPLAPPLPLHARRRRPPPCRAAAPDDDAAELARKAAERVRDWTLSEPELSSLDAEDLSGGYVLAGGPGRRSGDYDRERSRKYMRTSTRFTFARWQYHRSTERYDRHMAGILQSKIVRGLARPLANVVLVSTAVCSYETLRLAVPEAAGLPSLILPTAPFDLTSFALALLLVFRTNTSYDRWLECATVWSGVANRARDTARQLVTHLPAAPDGGQPPLAAAVCRWLVGYARALKSELVEDSDLAAELAPVMTPDELRLLLAAHHRPTFALSVLSELGAAAGLGEWASQRLDENLTRLEDAVGALERIARMPIPLSYTRHTSRFMVIWLTSLPLGLWDSCGWGTVPLSVVIAFLLLGIEEIGVQIEEPFGIQPIDDLCREIEGDVFSALAEAPSAKAAAAAAVSRGSIGAATPPAANGAAAEGAPGDGGPRTFCEWRELGCRPGCEDSEEEEMAALVSRSFDDDG